MNSLSPVKIAIFLSAVLLSACSSTQVYSNYPAGNAPAVANAGHVAVLYSYPTRPYDVIGVVSAKRYKPGWTDPTVSDAIPQLQSAGAQLGADAVVVRSSRSNNDRHTVVEAEAIRYLDKAGAPVPGQAQPSPPQQGEAMKWKPRGT